MLAKQLTLVVLATTTIIIRATVHGGHQDPLQNVRDQCRAKLDLKSLAEFSQFIRDLEEVRSSGHLATGRQDEPLMKCFEEQESIRELNKLITNYNLERPCKYSEVAKLEQFARKFLLTKKRPMAAKFFTLFGVQVGLQCKLNLLAHLKQADIEADQLDFIYSMASPTGWNVLINEYTKKSMKFGQSSHPDSHVISKIAALVPGLKLVEQLDYLSFDHVNNDEQLRTNLTLNGGIEFGSYKASDDGKEDGGIGSKLSETVKQIVESCKRLDQLYVNSLLSLARLKELGLLVPYLNDLHELSRTLHKWLAATSFCQLMVRVRVGGGSSAETNLLKLEILHDDQLLESRRQLYSYAAPFEEISQEARDNQWQASVQEGEWRQKSAAMLVPGADKSLAMKQLQQFIRGLERSFRNDEARLSN